MKASGLQEKALYDYNFANDSGINPEIRHAYTYVEKWEEMKKNATGLLIWGNVGTGKTATSEDANESIKQIRNKIKELYGEEVSEKVIILYGGSVKPENAKELFEMSDVISEVNRSNYVLL